MSAIGTILGGLAAIAAFTPAAPAAPFLAMAAKYEPVAETALPLLKDALVGGPDAFAAFKTSAPDFYEHLKAVAVAVKTAMGGETFDVSDHEIANLGAHVAGVDPPGWTHEETQQWWDRAQGTV